MVVGKTSSSISITELFEKYSEVGILTAVFPDITEIPCVISSPFRIDSNPSFSIYLDNSSHIRFKDFGDTSCKGSLLDLLCKKWNCSFYQVFDKILETMQKKEEDTDITIKPKQVKLMTRKESLELTKIQVAVRPWRQYDLDYWQSYGITKPWLTHAGVYPISHKIITKKDKETGKTSKFIFPCSKYTFCYTEYKESVLSIKIYSPFDKKHKWCSKMDASVVSLWTKVPEFGDKIIIASSTKDALCISCNLHIPAIAPQGEGYNLSETAINELKRRYRQIYISYDGDKAGIKDAEKLSKATKFPVIYCPKLKTPLENNTNVEKLIKEGLEKKDEAKDWSDIYLYFGKERFIEEFNKAKNNTDGRDLEGYTRI